MKLSIEAVDAKKTLRIAWIIESGLYFVAAFIVLFWRQERTEALVTLSPYLCGLILGQGAAGWSGSSVKRLTETVLEKAKHGGGDA